MATIDLSGRVGIVTGASGGIGSASAATLRNRGATVVGADVDTSALLEGDLAVDLRDPEAVFGLVEGTVSKHGRLDFLVNNAAVLAGGGPVGDCTIEQFQLTMDVNVRAPFLAIKAALPHMLARGGGAIVNIASVMGALALPDMAPYCMSKGAVLQLTRSVALDYASKGIRCNAICPGTIVSDRQRSYIDDDPEMEAWVRGLHPVDRYGSPQEIAEVVAFLVSDGASFIHGAPIHVDGGYAAW